MSYRKSIVSFLTLPLGQLEELFKTLTRELVAKQVIKGEYLAMDSTYIFAWASSSNSMYRKQFPESNSLTENSALEEYESNGYRNIQEVRV